MSSVAFCARLRRFSRHSSSVGGTRTAVAPEWSIAFVPIVDADADPPLLASFSDHLRKVRGLEPRTREGALVGGRRFLEVPRSPCRPRRRRLSTSSLLSASAVRIGDLRRPHGSDLSHPNVSSVSVLGCPPAVEAVKRMDALFDNRARDQRPVARPTEGLQLRRWSSFTRFSDDGRICRSNNAAERALRGIAISGSFCPSCAGVRGPSPLAPYFGRRLRYENSKERANGPDHSFHRRARACHCCSGLEGRSVACAAIDLGLSAELSNRRGQILIKSSLRLTGAPRAYHLPRA